MRKLGLSHHAKKSVYGRCPLSRTPRPCKIFNPPPRYEKRVWVFDSTCLKNAIISPRAGTYEYPLLAIGAAPGSLPTTLRKACIGGLPALTMLGMVTPQMVCLIHYNLEMQMASSQKSHFAVQDDNLDLNAVTPSRLGQFPLHKEPIAEAFFQLPEAQTKNASPTSVVLQHSFPQHVPLPAPPPSLPQNEIPSQGTISVVGVPLQLTLQRLHSLPTIVSLPIAQPSLTHHFQPVEQPQWNTPITSLQQSLSPHPSTSQFSSEESFLLQQLMRLTPEQLSSLPLDEQQQVLEIQRILHSKPT
ncbi:hypothetical protein IEQ34_010486 [Dendrobium chrysotoxum]|uniref:Uncharacterized protein n=1 Tax=Dendrobium chrysotoxum TaxID=161865 RepID=A0AAV7GVX4_DENCH|nr:hypothetical protein IEQ34_010486 [Dendrobium chrysotoxum]